MSALRSIPGVAHVVRLQGALAGEGTPPSLLVEVPHGADRPRHYHALAERLKGELPADLIDFFYVNTDVGAWDLGQAAAAAFLQRHPARSALLIRCLVPRTFIDCNRVLGDPASLAEGGLTPGLQPYIHDPADQALLRGLHAAYVQLTDAAYRAVCGAGGLALCPHTYAPRSVGIEQVDADIVEALHRVYAPERAESWPLRAEVDLITRDEHGARQAPPGVVEAVTAGLTAEGLEVAENGTYWLHPASRAAQLAARHPQRLLCLELRRDKAVHTWDPFTPMRADHGRLAPVARVVGGALADALA